MTSMIGAEINGVDLRMPLSPETVVAVKNELHRWKVLFFRDQHMTDKEQLAFARAFGRPTRAHPISAGMKEHPEIWERSASEYVARQHDISTPSITPPRRDYTGWHIDVTFVENPVAISILRGVKIPAYGGDTLWADLGAVYDGLSEKLCGFLDGLQAVHRAAPHYVDSNGDVWAALHPLVRVHPETGQKVLFVNPGTITHIHGLLEHESTTLLDLLIDRVMRPEYQVRFRWAPGSLAMWDNRSTAHVGPVGYAQLRAVRTIRRVSLAGDRPIGPDGFVSRALHGSPFLAIENDIPSSVPAEG